MIIEEKRLAAGLSRKEFCDLFLVPYRTLQDWELGARSCPPWALRLIVRELDAIALNRVED